MNQVYIIKTILCAFFYGYGVLCQASLPVSNVLKNPVVTIYDGCIDRFMGKYYAMGTGTDGAIYTSEDMVTWQGPWLAAQGKEAVWPAPNSEYYRFGAGDILYRNGVWHIYYNGIAHSYSSGPLGPYKEHSITSPFDNQGIDPQIFQDKNGEIYFIKKNNSTETHVFSLTSPFVRGNQTSNKILSAEKGHAIGSIDWSNFEGPEMFENRGRYFVSWSPNRMSPRSGMYVIGVAEGDAPLSINNKGKYPHPLINRNYEDMLLYYNQIIPTAEHGGWQALYTQVAPAGSWWEDTYDTSGWQKAQGGFGAMFLDDAKARIRGNRTLWKEGSIWIKRSFDLTTAPSNMALIYRLEDADATFFFNGEPVSIKSKPDGRGYVVLDIDASFFRKGENTISVTATKKSANANSYLFLDFGLLDLKENKKGEMAVVGPSQSNFITGPNGFERWMVYKAFWNSCSAQGITRLHFYDKEVTGEGCTTENTPGYHPQPALPSWKMNFLNDNYQRLNVAESVLPAYENYRLEIPFRIQPGHGAKAQIYAWYKDGDNYFKINILRDNKKWEVEHVIEGQIIGTDSYELPEAFEFIDQNPLVSNYEEPWHTLVCSKNGTQIGLELDHFDLTLSAPLQTQCLGEGIVGVEPSPAVSYDKVQLTAGFEEYDRFINGWDGECEAGLSAKGLRPGCDMPVVKGDLLGEYEFSSYMKHDQVPVDGESGFYPIYQDDKNYVSALINYQNRTLEIRQIRNGELIGSQSVSLKAKMVRQFNTLPNLSAKEQQYDFRTETEVSAANFMWYEGEYPNWIAQTFVLPASVELYALQNDSWVKLSRTDSEQLAFNRYNRFTFAPVKTKSIKLKLTSPNAKAVRAFCAYFEEELAAGYFLRTRRENGKLYIWLNNELKATLEDVWNEARIALQSSTGAFYNGIMHYHLGRPGQESDLQDPAREVFFHESFGKGGVTIADYDGNPGIFINEYKNFDHPLGYELSVSKKVSVVNPPQPSDNGNASGQSAMMFGGASASTKLQVGPFDTSDYSDIQLSYNVFKPSAPNSVVTIEYSQDGISWKSTQSGGIAIGAEFWKNTGPHEMLPSCSSLYIRFGMSAQYTLFDDIRLSGIRKTTTDLPAAVDASPKLCWEMLTDKLFVKGDVASIYLYTIAGKLVGRSNLPRMDISALRSGVYILQARFKSESKTLYGKVIKK